MDLKEIVSDGADPSAHWYYRTKSLPLLDFVSRSTSAEAPTDIVDVGAGSGVFSEKLMDGFPGLLGDVRQVDVGYPADTAKSDPRIQGRLFRQRELPASIRKSCVILMDVLEHVPDDAAFLKSIKKRCESGTRFFLTAPAFMSLWSPYDDYLGHYRRYTLPGLRRRVEEAGIAVESGYYIYGCLFPFVWTARKLTRGAATPRSRLWPAPRPVAWALESLCRFEFLFRKLNRVCGVSCVIEGRAR